MRKLNILICSLMVWLAACTKDEAPAGLPEGSISFDVTVGRDTLQMPVSILKDTTTVIGIKAALSGNTSGTDHWVNFAVDSTKIALYRAKYGAAVLLPTTAYFFYKPMVRLAAGSSVSEAAQLNIVQQSRLTEYTTYVLPIVIQSVDGQQEGPAASRIMYYVFKTGKPLFINKVGWTLAGFSSVNGTFAATNILDDNNTTTYWTSNINQSMPQWVAINFNREITFTGVTYYLPPLLKYPTQGGYPTSIQIETSMDGTNWVSKGVFAGNIENNMQTLNTGSITGRYLRFTVLASVKYASTYSAIFIAGISLVP